ncbi:MAG: DNA-directed RNA polymerase subunit beta, partial [Alphaproteobacteria bacterium]|nr:DNA-directed RNA polymerase subunit beta [Alphaproteobacteria bacterium]
MAKSFTARKRVRKSFGRIPTVAPMPNLIEVQKSSYAQFLQMDVAPETRTTTGLQEVFKSVFPIKDFSGRGELEYVKYEFEIPKYDVEECQQRGMTFAAPLKVTLRLVVWDIDEDTGSRSIRDIKEQDVYMGDMPLMTANGTFVINGTERVIVSQMHRSPGVFFDHDRGKTHSSGKYLYAARVIPYRGSWLDFEFDAKDMVYVRIDRRRKLPATTLLYALLSAESEALRASRASEGRSVDPAELRGMTGEEILNYFYDRIAYNRDEKGWKVPFEPDRLRGVKLQFDLVDAHTGELKVEAGVKMTPRLGRKLKDEGLTEQRVFPEELIGRYVAEDIVDEGTGEILIEAGEELNADHLENLAKFGATELGVLHIDHVNVGPYIRNTLFLDKNSSREEALIDIYRVMRPGEPPTLDTAEALFRSLFFDSERYDLSAVGRVKMNARLELQDVPDTVRI